MKKQLWVRFLAALLAAILLSQPVWGMADAWGGAEGAEGDAVEITEDVFPDAHFRRYIEKELDQDQDGQLSQSEREAVESLYLSGLEIECLEGIGYFSELVYLDCESNRLSELDLKGCVLLETLYCRDNLLVSVDARDCTRLRDVSCDAGVMFWRTFDVSGEGADGNGSLENRSLEGDGDETWGDGISQDSLLADGISENDLSGNDLSGNSLSGNDLSGNGISENTVSGDSISEDRLSENSLSGNGISGNSVSGDVISQVSAPGGDISENSSAVSKEDQAAAGEKICKVKFQSKGGSAVEAQSVVKGGKAARPKAPTKSKYTFIDWYKGSKKYDFTKPVTGNLTLTAKWSKVTVGKSSMKKLTNPSRGTLKIRFNKVKGAAGYRIQVSTDKNFKKNTETYTAMGTSLSIRDRKKNKTYYVRVRAYKLDSEKKKIYGKYCAKKKLKITKGIQTVAPSKTAASLTSAVLSTKKTVRVKAKIPDRVKSVDSYYYLFHLSGTGEKIPKNAVPDAKAKKSTTVTMKTPLDHGTSASKLQSKFVLAVKTSKSGSYTAISASKYIANPEKLASYDYAFPTAATKKGLQVDPRYMDDAVSLGVKHTAYNICLDDLIATPDQKNEAGGISYIYNGTTYWFNRGIVESIDRTLAEFREKNMLVSAILLLRWRDDLSYLIPEAARAPGHGFYALNTSEAKARKHWEAVFTFLAQRYASNKYIANWILGNEVNNYRDYHYTGSTALANNASIYANAYRLAYTAIRSVYAKARVYISLDQTWNYLTAYSHTSRQFLDKFAAYWSGYGDLGNFNIAFHPYPAPLEDPAFWTDSKQLVSDSINTSCISMGNLNILTNYVKMHWGSKTRVILSEQGFTSSRYGVQVEELQAAAMAYAYYLGEFNDMVDAFILHRHVDHQTEQALGLSLGLWTNDGGTVPATAGKKKYAWDVFKDMDTSKGAAATKFALARIGASSWRSVVPGYTTARFS